MLLEYPRILVITNQFGSLRENLSAIGRPPSYLRARANQKLRRLLDVIAGRHGAARSARLPD